MSNTPSDTSIATFDLLKKQSRSTRNFFITMLDSEVVGNDIVNEKLDSSEVLEIEIRALTSAETSALDLITSRVLPPEIYEEEPSVQVGTKKVFKGYNHDDPNYKAQIEQLTLEKHATACLYACLNFKDTPGDTVQQKVDRIMNEISVASITAITKEIFSLTAGVSADKSTFFLNNASAATSPSSTDTTKTHPAPTTAPTESSDD